MVSPSLVSNGPGLELESHPKPHVEGRPKAIWERRFVKVYIRHASRSLEKLIGDSDWTAVEDVEEISNKP